MLPRAALTAYHDTGYFRACLRGVSVENHGFRGDYL